MFGMTSPIAIFPFGAEAEPTTTAQEKSEQ